MESAQHNRLKSLASDWLRACGVRIHATEVVCPLSRFRLDVAGYVDSQAKHRAKRRSAELPTVGHDDSRPMPVPAQLRRSATPLTVVVECKVSRSDFIRDADRTQRLIRIRDALTHQRRTLEERILRAADPSATPEPGWLFDGLTPWDYSNCRVGSYQRVVDRLERVHRALHGRTKFEVLARYALADVMLIAAPANLLSTRDVPPGWGLVEFETDAACAAGEPVQPKRTWFGDQPGRPSAARFRERLLRNIAVSATRAAYGSAAGVRQPPPIDSAGIQTTTAHA